VPAAVSPVPAPAAPWRADGGKPQRVLKGDFTLPAWSDDGRAIAVAERKDGGRRWEISIVYLPEGLRAPLR
jgi:Tol biopolymer transport system component